MATQLNIKDRETVERARKLAGRMHVSVTEVVRQGLAKLEADKDADFNAKWARIVELTAPIAKRAEELGMTSDHRWIYEDENGNPSW